MKKLIDDKIIDENDFVCMILQYGNILRVQTNVPDCHINTIHKNMQNGDIEITIYSDLDRINPEFKYKAQNIKIVNFIVQFNNKLYLISKEVIDVDVYDKYVNPVMVLTLKTKNVEFREIII